MLSKEAVEKKEDSLRKQVRELPDEARLLFFKESEKKLKDPDTFATLNYVFIASLHHFYLGRWGYGLFNIALFWFGFTLLFTDYLWQGILLILGITMMEIYELFRSQIIVQHYNNGVMEKIYSDITKTRQTE